MKIRLPVLVILPLGLAAITSLCAAEKKDLLQLTEDNQRMLGILNKQVTDQLAKDGMLVEGTLKFTPSYLEQLKESSRQAEIERKQRYEADEKRNKERLRALYLQEKEEERKRAEQGESDDNDA